MMVSRPLLGTRILDLTRLAPGPFASLVLADLGAEVIKVEERNFGDPTRYPLSLIPGGRDSTEADNQPALFRLLNRDKKSITCNLKSIQGRVILMQLVSGADVLLEGFRPGVMERLGLHYAALQENNPRLVYASLSGYGQEGPYRDRACHDLSCLALSGWLDLNGAEDEAPALSAVPLVDMVAGLWTALAITSVLLARERTGQGCYLDMSMLDSVTSLMALPLAEMISSGNSPQRGSSWLSGRLACYNRYRTEDGRYMSVAALEPHFWQAFCVAVGREEWWPRQYESNQRALIADLAALFRTQPQHYWVELFSTRDCCCEPILSLAEAMSHPQMQTRGLWQQELLLTPVNARDEPSAAAPKLGEYTAQVLAELGYSPEDVERLRSEGVV
jgi:crotonobetainyl-CoA:carnitine CoA-transferase CaiB-like acyl-CoA transferase